MRGYADLVPDPDALMQRPLVLNSNMLLENTRANRELVWDWLGMAVARPHAFCMAHTQDQSAWTILVLNRSLPLVNPCPYLTLEGSQRCVTHQKDTNFFLSMLGEGAFEVVEAAEYDALREGYVNPAVSKTLPTTKNLGLAWKAVREPRDAATWTSRARAVD